MKLFYQEDRVRLYQGDNKDFFPKLKNKSVKLLFADPPYGINVDYDSPFTDDMSYYMDMMEVLLTEGLRVAKTLVITPGGYSSVQLWYDRMKPKWRFCWYKGSVGHRSKVGFAHWEEILIYGDDVYGGIPDFVQVNPSVDFNKYEHPCPKPEKLLAFFIDAYIKDKTKDIVFDPFAGSGTTLAVAKKLGVKTIGVELSESYCKIISDRLQQIIPFTEDTTKIQSNQEELFNEN